MKKTTIWISMEGVPMYSPNGWPTQPLRMDYDFCSDDPYLSACKSYERDLAKAKKEAIPFDDEYAIKRMLLHLVDYTPNDHVDKIWMNAKWPRHGDPKPDSFIEIEGEVEVVKQYRPGPNDSWVDVPKGDGTIFAWETRQVARVKPAEAVSDPGVGGYYNSAHGYTEGADAPLSAQQINYESQKHNEKFDHAYAAVANSFGRTIKKKQEELDAALKRVKELENDITDGFEKYQEKIVQVSNLKARVEELTEENEHMAQLLKKYAENE